MKIKVKKLVSNAKLPLVTDGNACFDFYANRHYVVNPLDNIAIKTGLAFEIPAGYHMKLFMRSSTGRNTGLRLSNCVGIVDSSYRGEVVACFTNIDQRTYEIKQGDRFLQGLIEKGVPVEFEEVDELGETKRGTGGFGSTGR